MARFSSTTLRVKVSLGLGMALALVTMVGLFGLLQLHAVNAVTREVREAWAPRTEALADIKRSISEHRLLAMRRVRTIKADDLEAIDKSADAALRDLGSALWSYRRLARIAAEQELFDRFVAHWNQYHDTYANLVPQLNLGEFSATLETFRTVSLPAFEAASGDLDALRAFAKEGSASAATRADQVYERALWLTLAVFALAAMLAVSAMMWMSRNITAPLLGVSDAMRRLSAGDLGATSGTQRARTDELGILIETVAHYRDSLISSRHLAEEASMERERLQAAVSNMPLGLVMFAASKHLIICNNRYREMYGLPFEVTQPGTPLRTLLEYRLRSGNFEGEDKETYLARLMEIVSTREPTIRVTNLADGRVVSIIHQPMDNGGWVATHEDVTDRRRAEERIHHMARHDALTDLPNRVLFKEQLETALKRVPRGESLAVLCLDLDRFKSVNDTLGHPVGDELLRSVADRLRALVRETDTIGRFGGDEFAIVQVAAAQPEGATALSRRVIEALGAPYHIGDHQIVIGASVGVAVAPSDGQEAEALLKNSDMALYRAKSDGRGTFRFFEPEMDARMQERRTLEMDLRKALVEREFELYYQPIVNAHTREVTCFEALLRWHHPQRGLVGPIEFIPLAEEIGLIVPIGEWVLRQACVDALNWPAHIKVAVNISPVQFMSKKLLETVITALAVSRLSASRLELEITEGVLLIDHEATLTVLHQLRALGVRIAMDDFGTGYSSLSYLRSFPFDKIKIDRSFIRDSSEEESSLAIIRAVTGLSNSLGMATTAEGVETSEQLDRIRAEGCIEAQGFLFSAARPAGELAALLKTFPERSEAAA